MSKSIDKLPISELSELYKACQMIVSMYSDRIRLESAEMPHNRQIDEYCRKRQNAFDLMNKIGDKIETEISQYYE